MVGVGAAGSGWRCCFYEGEEEETFVPQVSRQSRVEAAALLGWRHGLQECARPACCMLQTVVSLCRFSLVAVEAAEIAQRMRGAGGMGLVRVLVQGGETWGKLHVVVIVTGLYVLMC